MAINKMDLNKNNNKYMNVHVFVCGQQGTKAKQA